MYSTRARLVRGSLTEVAIRQVLFYDVGDQLRSLERDIVNTIFKPDCLFPLEKAAGLGYRLFSPAVSL